MKFLDSILNNSLNFAFLLVAILLLFIIFLVSGRKFCIGKYEIISAQKSPDFPEIDNLPYSFQREMVSDLKDSYKRRIDQICKLQYEESMNWENDFLKRVSALYKGANKVYAVTLSSISDFWVSESDTQLIIKYLKCQRGIEIHRLFVFDSSYDLKRYEEVLRANHHAYGAKGGVYITSSQNYQANILKNICDSKSRYRFLDKDFGIWESDISLLATLQGTKLSFHKVDSSNIEEIDVQAFKSIFSAIPNGVHRWVGSSNAEDYARRLFTEDVTYVGPIVHLVFMKHEDPAIVEEISSKIVELDMIQKEAIEKGVSINFSQDDPWWGVNLQTIKDIKPFADGKYFGQLRCDGEFQCVLLIKLPSIDDLRAWYLYESHSDIRKAVYSKLVGKVDDIYATLKGNEKNMTQKYQSIEELVWDSRKLRRMDFIFNKKLKDISPFKIYEQYINNP